MLFKENYMETSEWNVGQQCTLAVVEISFLPVCMSKIILSRSREKFFLFSVEPEIMFKPLWPVWPYITREIQSSERLLQQRLGPSQMLPHLLTLDKRRQKGNYQSLPT